jgi:hypothetical protein
MFIYREEDYSPTNRKTWHSRNHHQQKPPCTTGNVDLGFDKEFTLFRSLDTVHDQ